MKPTYFSHTCTKLMTFLVYLFCDFCSDCILQAQYSSKKLGYMYEFDCKPILHEKGIDTTMWKVVAFEHQVIVTS